VEANNRRNFDGRFAKAGEAISAEVAHEAKQIELAAREAGSPKGGTVQQLHPIFAAYLSHLERKGRDPKTTVRNRCALGRLNGWLNELGVDPKDVTEVVLEEYVAWLSATFAPTTAHRETAHVKAAYRYAVRLGTIDKSPAEYIEAPRVPEEEPEVYSAEELREIRAAIRDDLEEVIFYGLAYGGLRRDELVGLTWDAVNFEQQFTRVRGKGGKLRRVPLHPVLAEVLAAQLHRRPGSVTVLGKGGSLRNVNHKLAKLLKRAGVDGGNRPAHRFRKTVATVLAEEGVREDVIDKIMGWSPTTIRQRYYTRVADGSLYEAILKLYQSDSIERAPQDRLEAPSACQAELLNETIRRESLALTAS
jgi:integrase/recombinase XerD